MNDLSAPAARIVRPGARMWKEILRLEKWRLRYWCAGQDDMTEEQRIKKRERDARYREKHSDRINERIAKLKRSRREIYNVHGATYRAKHPMKARAGAFLRARVRSGEIVPANKCEECGDIDRPILLNGRLVRGLVADHYKGYARENWLVVEWICRRCDARRRKTYTLAPRNTFVV